MARGGKARAARQARVLADAARQSEGTSAQRPLNPDWDRRLMAHFGALDLDPVTALDDAGITRDAGCGGHELRAWLAAAAAARAAGVERLEHRYYRAIPEWVAGFGVMTGGAAFESLA